MFDNMEGTEQGSRSEAGPDGASQGNGSQPKEPQDIFSDVDNVTVGEPVLSKPQVFQPKKPAIENLEAYREKQARVHSPNGRRKFLAAGILMAVILIFFGAGAYFYLNIPQSWTGEASNEIQIPPADDKANNAVKSADPESKSPAEQNANLSKPVNNDLPEEISPAAQEQAFGSPEATGTTPDPAALKRQEPEKIDSDGDGLLDSEEQTLGTDPQKTDTDDDGLFDREEIRVYFTEPLVEDSDQDGYSDGSEVKNGYNPKGTGKLYDVNNN